MIHFSLLFKKDLLLQWKNKETLFSLLMFCISVMLLFHFSLPTKDYSKYSAGIYWISIFFTSILALQRFKEIDNKNAVAVAILASAVSRTWIYLSRVCSLFLFLQIFQLLLIPVFFIFFESRILDNFFLFWGLSALITLGISANGVTFSGLTSEAKFSEILLPILLFPLLIPLFLGALELSGEIFANTFSERDLDWVKLIIAYNLIFLSAGVGVYEFITSS